MMKYVLLVCFVSAVVAEAVAKKNQTCEFPVVPSSENHFTCENGKPKCVSGWQGEHCNEPICLEGCDLKRGYCKRPGECRCKVGFYGDKCDKCIPLPGCQHGYCNNSFECTCEEGWDGLFCTTPICQTGCHTIRGYCSVPGECRCRLGWSGANCSGCQPMPGCQQGYCDKPLECKCLPGYTGLLCQTPICAPGCHGERGYCRRPGECRCKVGWTGDNCAQCHPYPGCKHGTCSQPWECNCKVGWGGLLCDEKLNYCEKNPDTCKNGGKCQSLESRDGHFRCECPSGTTGKNCESRVENSTNTTVNSTIPPEGSSTEKNVEISTAAVDVSNRVANVLVDREALAPKYPDGFKHWFLKGEIFFPPFHYHWHRGNLL